MWEKTTIPAGERFCAFVERLEQKVNRLEEERRDLEERTNRLVGQLNALEALRSEDQKRIEQLERELKNVRKHRDLLYDLARAVLDAHDYEDDSDEMRELREELWDDTDTAMKAAAGDYSYL